MVSMLLVTFSLAGVVPGLGRIRRPTPVVRDDHARELRGRAELHALGRRMLERELPAAGSSFRDWRAAVSCTGSGSTGARTVFFQGS
jgi:hypothetical protein